MKDENDKENYSLSNEVERLKKALEEAEMKNRGSLYQSQSLIETIENLKKEIGAKSQIIDEYSGRLGNMTKEMDELKERSLEKSRQDNIIREQLEEKVGNLMNVVKEVSMKESMALNAAEECKNHVDKLKMDDNINLFKKSIKEADDKASVAIAEKKNKIDELTKQTEDFRANMEIIKKQKVKLEEAVAGYEERCSDLRHSLHKTSLNESALKKSVEEKTKCVENFEHEIHNLHMECDAIKENIQRKVDLVETMQQELENEK